MNEDVGALQTKYVDENGKETWKKIGAVKTVSKNEQLTKDLPLRIKKLLSPNARTKSDRRANYLYRHSHDKIDTNLLILFHGAGDSHRPYHELAKKMNLPQTASLSIHSSAFSEGFVKLPFLSGHTWFQQMDYSTGDNLDSWDERLIVSLNSATVRINQLLDELINDGWLAERIFLFGFSAGACLSIHVCQYRQQTNLSSLGGAICVSGGLICNSKNKMQENVGKSVQSSTEVLVLTGTHDDVFDSVTAKDSVQRYNLQAGYNAAELKLRQDKKHEMISDESDMREVMRFLGRKLVRRTIQMEGFCEIK